MHLNSIRKPLSIFLTLMIISLSFVSCAYDSKDLSQYLTKGEWFNYFVSENNMYHDSSNYSIPLSESSDYYDAVCCIVEYDICDAENACKDLDNYVTKDVVAYTCVNFILNDYRAQTKRSFDDANAIFDIEAAGEAVDYKIVSPKNDKKFGPNEYLNIDLCEKAIKATQDYESNFTFTEDESFTEIVYQDNVKLIDAEIEKVVSYIPLLENENYYLENSLGTKVFETPKVEFLGKANTSNSNIIDTKKSAGDSLIVVVSKKYFEKHKSDFGIGNIIKFKEFEVSGFSTENVLKVDYMEITDYQYDASGTLPGYYVEGVLPSDDQIIKEIKAGQKDTSYGNINSTLDSSAKSNGITGFTPTKNGLKFTFYKDFSKNIDLKNGRSQKTDPVFSGTIDASFEIKDISFTSTGLDKIFGGILKGSGINASAKINYKTETHVKASTDQIRFVPYNNGNGKFPSNLKRSRPTTGKGAQKIKVCNIEAPIKSTAGVLSYRFGVYLQIYADGSLEVSILEDNCRGVSIKKGKVTPIKDRTKEQELKVNVNLYAGLVLEAEVKITGTKTPIIDFTAGCGATINVTATLFEIDTDSRGVLDKQQYANIDASTMSDVVADSNYSDFVYCIDIKISLDWYFDGVTKNNSYLGKLIHLFNNKYKSFSGKGNIWSYSTHFEDDYFIDECMRKSKLDDYENHPVGTGKELDIDKYEVTLDPNSCSFGKGNIYLTKVPCNDKNAMKTLKGIIVESTDESICKATYFASGHYIQLDTYKEGACQILISTNTGKYKLACAVIVSDGNSSSGSSSF